MSNYSMRSSSEILINYYTGSYGSTIHVSIGRREILLQFKNVLEALANEDLEYVNISDALPVILNNSMSLELLLSKRREILNKTLYMTEKSSLNLNFLWIRSAAGWSQCAGLLEGLMEHDSPGHQYLTNEGIDDAVIEISYKGG